jgi:hypothetical protein
MTITKEFAEQRPRPCVTCKKLTPYSLRSPSGVHDPIPYCEKCFRAELEASPRKLLRKAKAAGFKTVDAWQDRQDQQQDWQWQEASLPKGDWE